MWNPHQRSAVRAQRPRHLRRVQRHDAPRAHSSRYAVGLSLRVYPRSGRRARDLVSYTRWIRHRHGGGDGRPGTRRGGRHHPAERADLHLGEPGELPPLHSTFSLQHPPNGRGAGAARGLVRQPSARVRAGANLPRRGLRIRRGGPAGSGRRSAVRCRAPTVAARRSMRELRTQKPTGRRSSPRLSVARRGPRNGPPTRQSTAPVSTPSRPCAAWCWERTAPTPPSASRPAPVDASNLAAASASSPTASAA